MSLVALHLNAPSTQASNIKVSILGLCPHKKCLINIEMDASEV
jgi:hypothetical protein